MFPKSIFTCLMVMAIVLTHLLFAYNTAAEDTSCYLRPVMDDVKLYVYEFEPGSTIEKHLFKGIVKKGDKQMIESTTGKIVFSYQVVTEDRSYGDNRERCVRGNWINVP